MTNHRTIQPDARKVIVGVDTHTHVHVAVAIDTWGIRLGDRSCAADSDGYQQLITWAERHGRVAAFGIEGTGSYGAGLARAVRRAGHQVLEVNRGDRRTRRIAGKSDTVDAETAARSVLAGQSTAIPKTADGAVEMMRHLKVARRTAVKARTSAMITLKQIVVTAPPALRETLPPLAAQALLKRCRGWRCGTIDTPTASAQHTLRALARRWFALSVEIVDHDRHLGRLTTQTSPTLREGFGIGADTAAEMLIIFGDNPDRIHAEAAFAKLCGACPIPASSGKRFPRKIFPGLIRIAGEAGSFRDAEKHLRTLEPYFSLFTAEEAKAMAEASVRNGQTWSASLCRDKYLPEFIRVQGSNLKAETLCALQYQVENDQWYQVEGLPEADKTSYGAKKRPRLGRCWSSLPSSVRLCRLRCSSSSSRSLAG